MRLIPIYLILTLAACQGATSQVTDAGADGRDATMLRFDTGADADTSSPDTGDAAVAQADSGADTTADATADALVPADSLLVDVPWWIQTDSGPQCDGPTGDCGDGTQCQLCIGYWLFDRSRTPDFCLSNGAFLNWRICNGY